MILNNLKINQLKFLKHNIKQDKKNLIKYYNKLRMQNNEKKKNQWKLMY